MRSLALPNQLKVVEILSRHAETAYLLGISVELMPFFLNKVKRCYLVEILSRYAETAYLRRISVEVIPFFLKVKSCDFFVIEVLLVSHDQS